ncbi:MAG: hypothetical protein F6K19_14020 [Cyanothece sp. SIO1E1]|nr:hypothetical protein [Cyanothece sp. SIO1E1]
MRTYLARLFINGLFAFLMVSSTELTNNSWVPGAYRQPAITNANHDEVDPFYSEKNGLQIKWQSNNFSTAYRGSGRIDSNPGLNPSTAYRGSGRSNDDPDLRSSTAYRGSGRIKPDLEYGC